MDYSFKNIILFLTERFLKNYSIYKKKKLFYDYKISKTISKKQI